MINEFNTVLIPQSLNCFLLQEFPISFVPSSNCRFKFNNCIHSKDDTDEKFPASWDDAILVFLNSFKCKEDCKFFNFLNLKLIARICVIITKLKAPNTFDFLCCKKFYNTSDKGSARRLTTSLRLEYSRDIDTYSYTSLRLEYPRDIVT